MAEDVDQTGQRLFLPSAHLGRMNPKHLRDGAEVLCALMASTATLAFTLGG